MFFHPFFFFLAPLSCYYPFHFSLCCYFVSIPINLLLIFQVLRNKPDFRRKPWPSISNSAKDFVKKLLVKDPRARLTASQALCKYLFFILTLVK